MNQVLDVCDTMTKQGGHVDSDIVNDALLILSRASSGPLGVSESLWLMKQVSYRCRYLARS